VREVLQNIGFYLVVVVAITAVIYYKKYKDTPLHFFPHFLWYMALLEHVGKYISKGFTVPNIWWFNIGINVEILFYLFVFYQYNISKSIRKFILYGGIVYELFFLINYLFFSESWNTLQSIPFGFGSFLVILAVFAFLIELFKSDQVLHVQKLLIFWVSIGLLLYLLISMPLDIVRSNIIYKISYTKTWSVVFSIQYVANILMYLSFIYGFIWSSMKYKSLSSPRQ